VFHCIECNDNSSEYFNIGHSNNSVVSYVKIHDCYFFFANVHDCYSVKSES
jgi:hypothetical protein